VTKLRPLATVPDRSTGDWKSAVADGGQLFAFDDQRWRSGTQALSPLADRIRQQDMAEQSHADIYCQGLPACNLFAPCLWDSAVVEGAEWCDHTLTKWTPAKWLSTSPTEADQAGRMECRQ